jgi:hypothetical protein
LLKALILWGRAYFLRTEGSDPDGQQLRTTIVPYLKHIGFSNMDAKEFARVENEFMAFSTEEKLKILKSLLLQNNSYMPEGLSWNEKIRGENLTYVVDLQRRRRYDESSNWLIEFSVDKPVILVGIIFPASYSYLYNSEGTIEIDGLSISFKDLIDFEGNKMAPLDQGNRTFILSENKRHRINHRVCRYRYNYEKKEFEKYAVWNFRSNNGKLDLQIYHIIPRTYPVLGFVFEPAPLFRCYGYLKL